MERIIFGLGSSAFVALVVAMYVGAKLYLAREQRADRAAVEQVRAELVRDGLAPSATGPEPHGQISDRDETWEERQDREFAQSPLAEKLATDYHAWEVSRVKATHGFMLIGQRRAERHFARGIDLALRGFGTSLSDVLAERQLADCHGSLSEMAEKAERRVAVDDTVKWPPAWDNQLKAMLAAGAVSV